MWKGVAKYNNLTAQQLGAADIVALSGFICGLNSSEIGSLNKEAFRFVLQTQLNVLVVMEINTPWHYFQVYVEKHVDGVTLLYITCLCRRDAIGSVNDIQCSLRVTQSLKDLAVSAFGDPSTWTEAHVSHLGNIVGEIISYSMFMLGRKTNSIVTFLKHAVVLVLAWWVSDSVLFSWAACKAAGCPGSVRPLICQSDLHPGHPPCHLCCR